MTRTYLTFTFAGYDEIANLPSSLFFVENNCISAESNSPYTKNWNTVDEIITGYMRKNLFTSFMFVTIGNQVLKNLWKSFLQLIDNITDDHSPTSLNKASSAIYKCTHFYIANNHMALTLLMFQWTDWVRSITYAPHLNGCPVNGQC